MIIFPDHPEFTPNYSPYKMFKEGIFQDKGGYFRPVYSRILGKIIYNDYKKYDWGNLPIEKLIAPPNKLNNKYKVAVGTSLEFWEDHGWINPQDPRGWVEWYCNFYSGRRTTDDERQIQRWIGIKNRFGKVPKTPAIKQTLLQWAIDWSKI